MRIPLLAALLLAAPLAPAARSEEPAPAAEDRVPALIRQLGSRYLDDRQKAQEALGRIGAAAEPALRKALDDPDARVRRAVCELLGRASPAAAPALAARLQDEDEFVRDAAREALLRLGPGALEAVRRAQQEGRLTEEVARPILQRGIQWAVEDRLNRCMTRGGARGHFKEQFRGIVELGPPAVPVLLALFTTPPGQYAFAYPVGQKPEEAGDPDERKLSIQMMAGDALADLQDSSVVPALKAFLGKLEKQGADRISPEPIDSQFYETAAIALGRLGEPAPVDRLVKDLQASAGVQSGAAGQLKVAYETDADRLWEQMMRLSKLSSLLSRQDRWADAEPILLSMVDRIPRDVERLEKDSGQPESELAAARLRILLGYKHCSLACVYSRLGRKAEAVEHLLKAAKGGYDHVDWLERDGDVEAIRGEAGYREAVVLMKRARQRKEALQRGESLPDH